jgi:uncharacterized protein YjbI with pentapeptide repeats
MNQRELNKILRQHQVWLESDGERGERANLRRADLQGADLRGADLHGAALMIADLRGADLDTNIRDCWSFEWSKFTSDALPWLILHPKWAEWKDSVQIEEV